MAVQLSRVALSGGLGSRVHQIQSRMLAAAARSLSSSSPSSSPAATSAAASSSSSSGSGRDGIPKFPPKQESALVASFPPWHKIVDRAKADPGNLVMNFGAVVSLSGFMMSDVVYLRGLSVCGSLCGIAYNFTRKPPQTNAVMWGMVFVSVNMYHLYYLYLERTEDMTFHHDEMLLYTCHFKEWGVEPWQFKKLVKLDGCRFRRFKRGDVVVNADQKLNDVLMVVKGEIGAENKRHAPLSKKPMYTYRGDGRNGCVIGGTALVDPNVRMKEYPNRLVCEVDDTVVVKWDTDKLQMVMETDKDIESAVLHALYTELIQGLRRDRQKKTDDSLDRLSETLLEYERMIRNAIKSATTEDGFVQLKPVDKREARVFAGKNGVTLAQRENLVWKHGWTMDEWHDGAKEVERKQKETQVIL